MQIFVGNDVDVRIATQKDRAAVEEVYLALTPQERYARFGNPKNDVLIGVHVSYVFASGMVFVAEKEALVVSVAELFFYGTAAELSFVGRAEYSGRGYTTRLAIAAIMEAHHRGVRMVTGLTQVENVWAGRIFQKLKFTPLWNSEDPDHYAWTLRFEG